MSRFETFLPFIFRWECCYARGHYGDLNFVVSENEANDPGGLTKFGIDAASHRNVDVAHLTVASATEIYQREWEASGAEDMPAKLGEVFFNACVNCGVGRAHSLLHDPATHNDAGSFLDAQEAFYRHLVEARPKLKGFLKGWLNRVNDLRKFLQT